MRKQIPTNVVEYLLGGLHHNLGIAVGSEYPDDVDHCGNQHPLNQLTPTSRRQIIDHRANHIGAQKVGHGADTYQHRYR